MLIAYIDESGDAGFLGSPSTHFALGAVLVHSDKWLVALDENIKFRRGIRDSYGVKMSTELKAQYLLRGNPSLGRLSERDRLAIYRRAMEFLANAEWARVFAVVLEKDKVKKRESTFALDQSWTFTVQRLQNWSRSENTETMILHDEGTNTLFRRTLRKMRRHHRAGSFFYPGTTISAEANLLIEDTTPRNSRDSYFIQLADLVAYAAIRKVFPTKRFGATAWDLLGPSRIKEVSKLRGGPYGIVKWP